MWQLTNSSQGYGIATPKGSRWRDRISQAILYLQEKSAIQVPTKDVVKSEYLEEYNELNGPKIGYILHRYSKLFYTDALQPMVGQERQR